MSVEWNNSRAWCAVLPPDASSNYADTNNQVFSPGDSDNSFALGFITVRPLNELVQPTDLATVPVNVYVSCKDLLVAVPSENNLNVSRNYTITESEIVTESEVDKEGQTHDTLLSTGADHDKACLMHFGEKIVSFRAAMKRYQNAGFYADTEAVAGLNECRVQGNLYPSIPSPLEAAERTDRGRTVLWNWLRYAYVGMRGGIRYRVRFISDQGGQSMENYVVARRNGQGSYSDSTNSYAITGFTVTNAIIRRYGASWNGTTQYHLDSNGGVEFEVPYYSENIFQFSFDDTEGTSPLGGNDVFINYGVKWDCIGLARLGAGSSVAAVVDFATAEDFTFLRFQGAPFITNP
jgi:hypothetical protein